MGLGDSGHDVGAELESPGRDRGEQKSRSLSFSVCDLGCHPGLGDDLLEADAEENRLSQRLCSRLQVTVCAGLRTPRISVCYGSKRARARRPPERARLCPRAGVGSLSG